VSSRRIQHARQILRVDLILHGRRVVAGVEGVDLERGDRAAGPESQVIDGRAAIAGNQEIIGNRPDIVRVDPFVANAAFVIARRLAMSAEAHAIAHATATALPKVLDAEPGACDLALCAVFADDL